MIGWLVRLVLIVAGIVAAWFVPRDSINFSVIQIGVVLVAVLLIAIGSLGIPRVAAAAAGVDGPQERQRHASLGALSVAARGPTRSPDGDRLGPQQ